MYDRYFHLAYAYVARRVGERAATEDVTAEVFRKALASLPRFKWRGAPFGAWLLRIASNLIADRAKHSAREVLLDRNELDGASSLRANDAANASSRAFGLLPQSRSGSRQAQQTDLEEAERRALLFQMVDELAKEQRRVVMMRFAEEKSIHEIANELGRSEGAVKQLQFRALQNLRKRLTTENTETIG